MRYKKSANAELGQKGDAEKKRQYKKMAPIRSGLSVAAQNFSANTIHRAVRRADSRAENGSDAEAYTNFSANTIHV